MTTLACFSQLVSSLVLYNVTSYFYTINPSTRTEIYQPVLDYKKKHMQNKK